MMREHHTKNKGDYGVLKVQVSLFEQGYSIFTPQSEHEVFDLVAYKDGKFKRIQVKYRSAVNGRVDINLAGSWADRNKNHRTLYDKAELDVMAVFCPETDLVYFVDIGEIEGSVLTLRITEPKNGQKKGVRLASEYTTMPE